MIKLVNRMGVERRLPPTILLKRVPFTVHVPYQPIAPGDGAVKTGKVAIPPRQFALEGRIYYPGDKERIRQELDGLLPFLMRPPIEVHHHGRFLRAHPLGAPQDWIDEGAEIGIQLPMVALDPYWYGAEVVEIEEDAGEWSVDVTGNAPALPVVTFSLSASGASIELLGPGGVIELDGGYQSGDVVTVDTTRFEATLTRSNTTEPINDRLSDEYVAHGFELVPGANGLGYDGPEATVTLTYRPRWY